MPLVGCPRERHHLIYNGRVLLDAAVLHQEGLHLFKTSYRPLLVMHSSCDLDLLTTIQRR